MLIQTVVLGLTLLLAPVASSLQPGSYSKTLSHVEPDVEGTGTLAPGEAQKVIANQAETVLTALKHQDMNRLQQYIHPEKGIRFSPYATVDVNHDLIFKAGQLPALPQDKTVYTWGTYDGSGAPIQLTFQDYYKRFVYDRDYVQPEKIGYNEIVRQGNSVINLREAYPHSIFIEYHFSRDADQNEMGWSSLRLVFQKHADTWYLAGIVHDQWTI
ncbi:hypothetical protein [Paenibacillus tyrfis]|uniref:hypothetical protein n=1 Tax=Paenibacillus tyrfis TaxID=1501230 RepID=UPI0020A19B21|nr:hypothetical protein [Paenibacillus tyrfis]MCP1311138.1 hypothetical protein [Paenibacillus tyrfis]